MSGISGPLTIEAVGRTLGINESDLGSLIARGGQNGIINRFAKYKPICTATRGVTGRSSGSKYWQGDDGGCGLDIPRIGAGGIDFRRCAKEWRYLYPGWNGFRVWPYRLLDFDGYNHDAQSDFVIKLAINGHELNDESTTVISLNPNINSVNFQVTVPPAVLDDTVLGFNDLKVRISDGSGYWINFVDMPVGIHIMRQANIDGAVELPDIEHRARLGDIIGKTHSITHDIQESMLLNTDLYASVFLLCDAPISGGFMIPAEKCVRLKFRLEQYTERHVSVANFSNVQSDRNGTHADSIIELSNGHSTSKSVRVVYILDVDSDPLEETLYDNTFIVPPGESITAQISLHSATPNYRDRTWTIDCFTYWDGGQSESAGYEIIPPINMLTAKNTTEDETAEEEAVETSEEDKTTESS